MQSSVLCGPAEAQIPVTAITAMQFNARYSLWVGLEQVCMHELSIATAILESVQKEAELREGARMLTVGLRIGELAGVDPDSLTFGWEAITKDTLFEDLKLKIKAVPWLNCCDKCQNTFGVVEYQTKCPVCGNLKTDLVSGDELEITYFEIEEPEVAQV
jgi:hydrogenase nickel incorporation protein HypA/HybF